MKVTGVFKDPLTRILDEAVRIKDLEDDPAANCLNSKGEYFQSQYIRTSYTKGTQNMWTFLKNKTNIFTQSDLLPTIWFSGPSSIETYLFFKYLFITILLLQIIDNAWGRNIWLNCLNFDSEFSSGLHPSKGQYQPNVFNPEISDLDTTEKYLPGLNQNPG